MNERRRPSEVYRRLWANQVPDLDSFVEQQPQLTVHELADIIEIDQSEHWRRGSRTKAENYLKRYPALSKEIEAAILIIYGEYFIRTEMGENPSVTEYLNRFPKFAKRLHDQIQWHEALDSDSSSGLKDILSGNTPQNTPSSATLPLIPEFELLEKIGSGGVCNVYRARRGDDEYALKILHDRHRNNEDKLARMKREAEFGCELTHPNIVQVLGYGENPPHLWMEYCAEGTLAQHCRRKAMDPNDAARTVRDLARAVQYAHDQGIIHRDLKPANILLTTSGVPKISDFGLAYSKHVPSSITATGDVFGTPAYMSPEQTHAAENADERSDIYALGAILYECLTGRPPYLAPSPIEVIAMIRELPPIAPSDLIRHIPKAIEQVCLDCLSKDPHQRPATAADVANRL